MNRPMSASLMRRRPSLHLDPIPEVVMLYLMMWKHLSQSLKFCHVCRTKRFHWWLPINTKNASSQKICSPLYLLVSTTTMIADFGIFSTTMRLLQLAQVMHIWMVILAIPAAVKKMQGMSAYSMEYWTRLSFYYRRILICPCDMRVSTDCRNRSGYRPASCLSSCSYNSERIGLYKEWVIVVLSNLHVVFLPYPSYIYMVWQVEIECTGLRSILVSVTYENERGGRVHHSNWDSTGSSQRRILDGIPASDIAEFPRRSLVNSAQRSVPERRGPVSPLLPTTEPVRMQPVRDGLFVYRMKTISQVQVHTLAGIDENPGSVDASVNPDDSTLTAATRLEGNTVWVELNNISPLLHDILLTL